MRTAYVTLTSEGRKFLIGRRNEINFSQDSIKKFDQSTISDWENGRYDPKLNNLKTYLKLLSLSQSFLNKPEFINEIKYKFVLPNIKKKTKIKIYNSNDLQIVLTKKGINMIKSFRKNLASQNAVAFLSRIDQISISRWEKGTANPAFKRFRNYLEIIGINFDGFLKNKKFVKEIQKPIIRKMIDKSADSRRKKILPQNGLTKEKAYLLGVIGLAMVI